MEILRRIAEASDDLLEEHSEEAHFSSYITDFFG
jgi:hypothetical protein